MRRVLIALFASIALLGAFTVSAGAQDSTNCDDYEFQEDAQAVYDADQNDPNGLDGPVGPDNDSTGTPGLACEDLPSNGGATDDGATDDDGASDDDGATDDGTDGDGATDDGVTEELPDTGTGTSSSGSDSMLLVTVLGGAAALLSVTALRTRQER